MSLRPSIARSPVACSGDMYCGVPSDSPVCVMRAPPALMTASAMPKSATTGCAVLEQNVLGLEIAMNDAVRVRVVERARDRRSRCEPLRRPAAASRDRAVRAAIRLRRTASRRTAVRPLRPSRTAAAGWDAGGCAVTRISLRKRSTPSTAPQLRVEHLERDEPRRARRSRAR